MKTRSKSILNGVVACVLTVGVIGAAGGLIYKYRKTETHTHTEETLAAVEATCTETGLTEGKKCSVCGEVITAQEVVPATGHTEETLAAVEATCTETGLTEGKKCSVCGEVITAQEVVPATGHTAVEGTTVAATATAKGKIGTVCASCGEIISEGKESGAVAYTSLSFLEASDDTFTVSGNRKTFSDTVQINSLNTSVSTGLKMESSTSVKFTLTQASTITIYLDDEKSIKITDGSGNATTYKAVENVYGDYTVCIELAAGDYTISKVDSCNVCAVTLYVRK